MGTSADYIVGSRKTGARMNRGALPAFGATVCTSHGWMKITSPGLPVNSTTCRSTPSTLDTESMNLRWRCTDSPAVARSRRVCAVDVQAVGALTNSPLIIDHATTAIVPIQPM